MIQLNDWRLNREKWLDSDLALMTSNDGWKLRSQKKDIPIWQRSFADDKNDLFRWRLPRVAATHHEVFDVFVNKMVDYHHYWTAEYTGGFLVQDLDENAQIIYQQFNPGVPFIAKRDLLYVQWSRKINDQTMQTSFRSIVWGGLPVPTGFERIDWWGGHLFEANPDGSSQLVLIDRENQGGLFPSFMMNQIMPQYLTHQFESIVQFFDKGGVEEHEKLPDSQNTALNLKNVVLQSRQMSL
jgi:START domain